jgi:hypothetical protein
MPPMAHGQRLLMGALVASNIALLTHIFFPLDKLLKRCMNFLLRGRATTHSPTGSPAEKDKRKLGELLGKDYTPPLPKPVAEALERSCLCFLATANALEPHLSLMRYTYTRGLDPNQPEIEEVMVLSTQRQTKKYEILTANENVALLVHDFVTHRDGDEDANYEKLGTRTKYSITLNGTVRVETGELADRYRQIHLARNEAYKQFIVGPDIAIITVHLTRARVCDVNDNVTHYGKTGETWAEINPSTPPLRPS